MDYFDAKLPRSSPQVLWDAERVDPRAPWAHVHTAKAKGWHALSNGAL
jgi:hypothetical protein